MKYIITIVFCLAISSSIYAQPGWKKITEELIFSDPPFASCHASSIVEVSPGKLMVACFGGSEEGAKDVNIWLTSKENNQWIKPVNTANGVINDSLKFPCWNPVLFREKQGKLFLFYKVGPSPAAWWGMVITSADGGKSWSDPARLPAGTLGPIKNKPVQLSDGTILSPSSKEENNKWKVHIERSEDRGKTWEIIPIDSNSNYRVIQPTILEYPAKRLQMLCRSDQDKIVQSWSDDNGKTWGKLSKSVLPNPNSGIDAVTLKDGSQLLVYNPTIRGKAWFNNRGKLNVAISRDGVKWNDICILENGEKEEFSYPAVIQTEDGNVHITYTYDRKNIKHVVLAKKTK